jgi:hypothetical protein
MRRAKITFGAVVLVTILAGLCLALAWRHAPVSAPLARIYLIDYTNFTMSNPDTNVFCFPERGSWLSAHMMLTNEGHVTISYGAWGNEPYGWANVQTGQGTTNGYLAPPFTGGTVLLKPGCATRLSVTLPINALTWECGFSIETASVRERAISRVLESKYGRKMPEVLFAPMQLLSDKAGPSVELKSGPFEITNLVASPRTNGVPGNRGTTRQADDSGISSVNRVGAEPRR